MGEYDAGYENYIDGLHREIIDYQIEVEQVKGENAELVMKLNAEHLVRQNVERENAKLRELCVKALEWLRWAGGITCPPEVPDEFADELRELGVEVDA